MNPPSDPRAKITFTRERASNILDGNDEGYRVIRDTIVDTRRWSIDNELIIQRVEDNRFFRGYYSVGATESQDESPWENSEPDFEEVFPVERVTIAYK